MVNFRILGPVRLQTAHGDADIGTRKIRGLLGILALSANSAVPIDTVVDRLWDKPPPDPIRTLQGYVSRLRSALDRVGLKDALRNEHGHYRLCVDRPDIDYYRFQALAGRGQRAARDGNHEQAVSDLPKAIGLWAGKPLADVRSSWAQRIADTLTVRDLLPAYHSLFQSYLALDLAEYVLEQLHPLLDEYETDETFAELQMRALASVNGPSSAVTCYHDFTQRLRNVYGTEPSDSLVRVYQELIKQEPIPKPSAPPANSPATVPRPAPLRILRGVRHFIGRRNILHQLDDLLLASDVNAIVALDGAPGSGKTALSVQWAHQRQDRFPDGVLYADLNGYGPGAPVGSATVLTNFLVTLGVPLDHIPPEADARVPLLQHELTGRRVLVLLDNARDSEHIEPLLTATSVSPVLVTSRQQLSGLAYRHGAHSITVPTLLLDESIALLESRIGAARARENIPAMHTFAALCDGLPLALRIVGEHVAARHRVPLPELVRHLQSQRVLDAGGHGDRGSTPLRLVFDWSVNALKPDVAHVFRLLGLHPSSEVSIPVITAMAGIPVADIESAFDDLIGAHLIEQQSSEGYRLHDLLKLYAADRAARDETPEDRHAAIHRMVDWYLYTAINAMRYISPQGPVVPALDEALTVEPLRFRGPDEAIHWCLTERAQIIAAAHCASRSGLHEHVWRLVATVSEVLNYYGGDPREIMEVHQTALSSAQITGARFGEASNLNNLGVVEFNLGNYEKAATHFTKALAVFREIDHEYGEAVSLYNIGNTHLERGYGRRAIAFHEQSLAISTRIDSKREVANTYHRLGEAYQRLDQPEKATAYYQRALAIRTQLPDPRGKAATLTRLATLALEYGDLANALELSEQALALSRQTFDQRKLAEALRARAVVVHKAGDLGEAMTLARESARLCHMMGDSRGEAHALDALASTLFDVGEWDAARSSWSAALVRFEQLHDARSEEIRDNLRKIELSGELPTQRVTPATGRQGQPVPPPTKHRTK